MPQSNATQSPPSSSPVPTSGAKTPMGDRLTELVLQVLKPGSITVGSLTAFWHLLKQDSDVQKAIVSACVGIGLSYGAKVLTPIHKGNEGRCDGLGKAVNQGIDAVINALINGVKQMLTYLSQKAKDGTPEERYLACQALACQTIKSEGMIQHDGIFKPLLAEVFVSLAIDESATRAGFNSSLEDGLPKYSENGLPNGLPNGLEDEASAEALDPEQIEQRRHQLSIWDFLVHARSTPTFRRLAILAWGGAGKTTLLKHIAYCCGSRQIPKSATGGVDRNRIPFLLILRKHRGVILQNQPPTLPELINQTHIPNLPGVSDLAMPENWTETVLRTGRGLVMLDGFDEVPQAQRPTVAAWMNQQMQRYRQSVFIVTSRPKAYRDQHQLVSDPDQRLELATSLWVQKFDAHQRQNFVKKWYLCQERYASGGRNTADVHQEATLQAQSLLSQIEARSELKALAKNPLLLNMMVTFHRRNPGAEIPKRRVELYKEICQLQLKDRPSARKLDTLLNQCEAQTIVQQVALTMMLQRWERIERGTLLKELNRILQQQGEAIDAAEFLEQVVQISELLVQQEDEYEFAHLSFQEYLAATYLVKTKQERLLYGYFHDDKWKPTILLYVAQVKNPTTLIQAAMDRGATDFAYQCCQELPKTRRVDPALVEQRTALQQTVMNSRYQKLEAYLKKKQWKEADNETLRLMITQVGKEEGEGFEAEELLNYPCDDLLVIDGLWLQYSQGKFGFSVQKGIYLDCGGVPDGQYHKQAWNKFGDRVQWRENSEWTFNVRFETSSPRGHLPWGVLGVWGWVWCIFFSRIAHCGNLSS